MGNTFVYDSRATSLKVMIEELKNFTKSQELAPRSDILNALLIQFDLFTGENVLEYCNCNICIV